MPLERTSKPFKDISLSFVRNPATDDVTTLSNERAIARSNQKSSIYFKRRAFFSNQILDVM